MSVASTQRNKFRSGNRRLRNSAALFGGAILVIGLSASSCGAAVRGADDAIRAATRATRATSTHGGQLADGVQVVKSGNFQTASVVRGGKSYEIQTRHVDTGSSSGEIEPEDFIDYMKCTVRLGVVGTGLYENRTELQRGSPTEDWQIIAHTEGLKDAGEACAEAGDALAG